MLKRLLVSLVILMFLASGVAYACNGGCGKGKCGKDKKTSSIVTTESQNDMIDRIVLR